MVKNPPSSIGDKGLIHGGGTKIPHAAGQLSPLTIQKDSMCCKEDSTQLNNIFFFKNNSFWLRLYELLVVQLGSDLWLSIFHHTSLPQMGLFLSPRKCDLWIMEAEERDPQLSWDHNCLSGTGLKQTFYLHTWRLWSKKAHKPNLSNFLSVLGFL